MNKQSWFAPKSFFYYNLILPVIISYFYDEIRNKTKIKKHFVWDLRE